MPSSECKEKIRSTVPQRVLASQWFVRPFVHFFTFIYLCFILDFKFFTYNVCQFLAVTGFQNTQMSGSLHLYLFLLPWMLFLLFVCFIPFGCTSFCFTLSYLIIISQNPACFLMLDKKAMCLKLLKITLALVL